MSSLESNKNIYSHYDNTNTNFYLKCAVLFTKPFFQFPLERHGKCISIDTRSFIGLYAHITEPL